MRGLSHTRPSHLFPLIVGVVVAVLLLAVPGSAPAQAADPRLESAREEREAVQARLDEVLSRLDRAQAATAEAADRVADLEEAAEEHAGAARRADRALLARVRNAYKRGQLPAALSLLNSTAAQEATERGRLLVVMAAADRADSESASSAQIRATASADQLSKAVAALEAHENELEALRVEVADALSEAQAKETNVERKVAAEQAARERAARARAARSAAAASPAPAANSGGGGSASVSGGIACPVGTPRSYSDTWGAPRSGGRTHKGTDILAPRGTPSYAYEAGTILRMNSSSLGGISLYLRGRSGNVYYYTHLNGYASGTSVGKSVSAGDLIAYVGDTGNARGIPHLHFEVAPGGGGAVNPYPYVQRACG